MSAPALWIAVPIFISLILRIFKDERAIYYSGSVMTFLLALAAGILPVDSVMSVGGLSIKIATTITILGRRIILTSADKPLLVLFFGVTFIWFALSGINGQARKLIPNGLMIIGLFIASLAVEPFLYAALLIEIAVILTVPLLSTDDKRNLKGILRFVIFQTLAMPFILFSGWLLAGVDASPGNLTLVTQASFFLGLGFALLLAIFPFHTWMPMMSGVSPSYLAAFILWFFPTTVLLFGLSFLDRYAWLRDAQELRTIFGFAGMLLLLSGGLFAGFQRNFGRVLGYFVIAENGLSLLTMSLVPKIGFSLFYFLLVPRAISMIIWAFCLSLIQKKASSLDLIELNGFGKQYPLLSVGILVSQLSLAGLPLLASFPIRQELIEILAIQSKGMAFLFLIGSFGLLFSAIRTFGILFPSYNDVAWNSKETIAQRVAIGIGLLLLLVLGIFPQLTAPLASRLPFLFQYLGQ